MSSLSGARTLLNAVTASGASTAVQADAGEDEGNYGGEA